MKRKQLSFSRLIFEFISVSFAVLIALFVNQWREDYNNKKLAHQAIDNIREEFIENKEAMDEFIPYHKSLLFSIDSLISLDKNKTIDIDTDISLNITLISSSAWEMAKITNAIFYLDFDDANNLAKIYNFQSYYSSIIKQYVLKNTNNYQESTDLKYLKNTKGTLETIIPMEKNLKDYYDLMLTEVLIEENNK